MMNSMELEHGKTSTYTNHKCRCDECRAAMRKYNQQGRADRKARMESGETQATHGVWQTYQIHCCRCELCKYAWNDYNFTRKYGITLEQRDTIFAEQGSVCAACGSSETNGLGWHLDHDHETGRVRAVLCQGCNLAFGLLGENPARIKALMFYAARHWKVPASGS